MYPYQTRALLDSGNEIFEGLDLASE